MLTIMNNDQPIVLTIASVDELLCGCRPGRPPAPGVAPDGWDDVGAALGKPGTDRLVRMAHQQPASTELVLRISDPATDAAEVRATLRRWCHAKVLANLHTVRQVRRLGWRTLGQCMVALAVILGLAFVLREPDVLGPAGPLRLLLSEAVVIAGWVALWRPLEMVLFDPMEPLYENRALVRILGMNWRTEAATVSVVRG
jgi:hypothetical protein